MKTAAIFAVACLLAVGLAVAYITFGGAAGDAGLDFAGDGESISLEPSAVDTPRRGRQPHSDVEVADDEVDVSDVPRVSGRIDPFGLPMPPSRVGSSTGPVSRSPGLMSCCMRKRVRRRCIR